MAEYEYRLAVGWITKTVLESSDAYLLTAFPVQSDQISIYLNPWGPPADEFTTYPAYVRYGQFSNETKWSDGALSFIWGWGHFTEAMIAYWEGLLFGGVGLYTGSGTQSTPVTVKTRRHDGGFLVAQCFANRATPNVDYKRGFRGADGYKTLFVGGTEIFA